MRPAQLSGLDLNLLVVADALLENHSVTHAAETVNLSQPAVSRALGRLRAQLGNELLVRDGRGLVLTPFAKSLRPRLRSALMALERALFATESFVPADATGALTIASQDYAAFSYLPEAIARFAREAPNLEVAIVPYREPYEALLEGGEVDVAVGPRPSAKSWIASESLFVSPWVCVGGKSHRFVRKPSLESFCSSAHVLVSPRGQGTGPVDEALERIGKRRHVRLRVYDFAAALAICAQSDLLAVVPEALATSACRVMPLAARSLPIPLPPTHVYMSWHIARNEEPRHAWLREQIVQISGAPAKR